MSGFSDATFQMLDSDRWDDRNNPDPTEQDERDHVARVLRSLRKQPACSVTTDLLREWTGKGEMLMAFQRADRAWQRSGRTPLHLSEGAA